MHCVKSGPSNSEQPDTPSGAVTQTHIFEEEHTERMGGTLKGRPIGNKLAIIVSLETASRYKYAGDCWFLVRREPLQCDSAYFQQ